MYLYLEYIITIITIFQMFHTLIFILLKIFIESWTDHNY